jgi:hypothetical protein
VRSGDELPEKCRELAIHFETQGTPVMIGMCFVLLVWYYCLYQSQKPSCNLPLWCNHTIWLLVDALNQHEKFQKEDDGIVYRLL